MPEDNQEIEIHHPAEVGAARRLAVAYAQSLGFASRACEDMALVATELATNLVKHAGGGRLVLTPLAENGRQGLQIETFDTGPGIADVPTAMTDGVSTSGSCGYGLGSVNRLMDHLEIHSLRGQGTHVISRKWLRSEAPARNACPLDIGVATRSKPGLDLNGDDFVIRRWDETVLVGVIDGLGHGEPANRAAKAARRYIDSHYDLPLEQIFNGTGIACRATRGCVMALARFDWGNDQLEFASVGNIEVRVLGHGGPYSFCIRRGIVGLNAPEAKVTRHPWARDNLLVLHSDGLPTRWRWEDFPDLTRKPASQIAQCLLHTLAKALDDATVLVVKGTGV
jgi:anti-sigma regulatory factor (Ser/Thr protein kinase)